MAVGSGGKIIRSTDTGATFSTVTPYDNSNDSMGVTFGNNFFVGVSGRGKTGTSTDNGTSFSNVNSPRSSTLYGVTFGNNNFVAVGSSGDIVKPTNNGASWNWNNTISPITTDLKGVTFSE